MAGDLENNPSRLRCFDKDGSLPQDVSVVPLNYATKFIAHLVNQLVAHKVIALELLAVLLEYPTDDGVEVPVWFVKECGALLQDISPQGLHGHCARFECSTTGS